MTGGEQLPGRSRRLASGAALPVVLLFAFLTLQSALVATLAVPLLVAQQGGPLSSGLALGALVVSAALWWAGAVFGRRLLSERRHLAADLAASEERLRDFGESASDWFWETGPDYRYRYASKRFGTMMGFEASAYMGKTRFELALAPPRGGWAAHRADLDARRPFRDLVFTIADGAGRRRVLRLTGQPVFLADGRFEGYRGTGSDITAAVEAELALKESRDILQSVIDAIPVVITVKDRDGRFVIVNRYQAERFAMAPEEQVGKRVSDLLEGEVAQAIMAEDCRVIESGAPIAFHDQSIDLGDGPRIMLSSKVPLAGTDGEVKYVISVAIDVTDRAVAEATLREQEAERALVHQRLLDAVESIRDGFALFDAQDRLVLWNSTYVKAGPREMAQLVHKGMSFEDIVRTGVAAGVYAIDDGDSDRFIAERLRCHRNLPSREEISFSDGTLVQISEQRTQEGGIVLIRTDLTEIRRRDEELRQAQKMEVVGQLTGGVAHDFNNILAIIVGNLELVLERMSDESYDSELVRSALVAGMRGSELTGRLLAFSRRQTLSPVPTDVELLIRDMSELAKRTLPEIVEVVVELGPDLRRVVVDPHQLENALLNLVLNARDALLDGGTIRLAARNWPGISGEAEIQGAVDPGRYVLISVEDDGTGIPTDVIDKVFEPFFTTKEVGKGSGLGLPMVYGFVKQSGGHVELGSAPGRGTRVHLYLPAGPSVEEGEETALAGAGEALGHYELVLVVEDDQEVRRVVCRMLDDLGYRHQAVGDALAGLELIRSSPDIALLLSDVTLPKRMNGVELARRALRLRPGLAILLMSGYVGEESATPPIAEFSGALIHKPFRSQELATMIRRSLDQVSVAGGGRVSAASPTTQPGA